jgi:hypothetical protein
MSAINSIVIAALVAAASALGQAYAYAQEASALPSGPLKAYCAVAGDTSPAVFSADAS